jgi:hypothetical protein
VRERVRAYVCERARVRVSWGREISLVNDILVSPLDLVVQRVIQVTVSHTQDILDRECVHGVLRRGVCALAATAVAQSEVHLEDVGVVEVTYGLVDVGLGGDRDEVAVRVFPVNQWAGVARVEMMWYECVTVV